MFAKGQTVVQLMEQLAPKHYALPDDKIGLQVGNLQGEVRKVLVTLDVTGDVVDEAVKIGAELIIAHHPVIFRPLSHLRTDLPAGKLFAKLLKHDIAVYAAHTNFDVADGGMNDMMAERLGLEDLSHLEEVHTEKLKKLVVFVPVSHHRQVQDAVFQAGAGCIGGYSHCSFNLEGTGTFLPGEGANPFIGKPGEFEQVQEIRFETVVPESVEKDVIRAMLKAHPYEEVAYDLYPMDLKGRTFGLGRVGRLPREVTLQELAEEVKRAFEVPMVRVVGPLDKRLRKAAVLGGSGRSYVHKAIHAGADVLITGDMDYHSAQDALAAGLAIIDPGHHAEKIMKKGVADYLNRRFREQGVATEAVPSRVDTEVFRFL